MNPPKAVPVALALGANLNDRLESLRKAVSALSKIIQIDAVSSVYETAPAYVTDQPVFLNAAISGTTTLEPLALLRAVKDMENDIGRRPTFRYGPRVIDIDVLFYDDQIMDTPELILPHPRMQERTFVLTPLSEIKPDWRHPRTGKTVAEMLAVLPPADDMKDLGKILA